jgi:hypothetical protein
VRIYKFCRGKYLHSLVQIVKQRILGRLLALLLSIINHDVLAVHVLGQDEALYIKILYITILF